MLAAVRLSTEWELCLCRASCGFERVSLTPVAQAFVFKMLCTSCQTWTQRNTGLPQNHHMIAILQCLTWYSGLGCIWLLLHVVFAGLVCLFTHLLCNHLPLSSQFMCCGYGSYQDWLNTSYINTTGLFPDSCNCTNVTLPNCFTTDEIMLFQPIYNRNCSDSVAAFVAENLIVIGAVGITFALIEVCLLFGQCTLH